MLGVGKAAPAQFILRGKTNLRRISAAGQKAGFTAYPSHWASIWGALGTSEQASYRLLTTKPSEVAHETVDDEKEDQNG